MGTRQSIIFDEDVIQWIDNWRRQQKKIPSFSKAVNKLLKKYFKLEEFANQDIVIQ